MFIEDWLKTGTPEAPHTQEVLADTLSKLVGRAVSQSSVSNIKSGAQSPRADLVAAFHVALGIEAEWWLPEADSGALPAVAIDNEAPKHTGTGR